MIFIENSNENARASMLKPLHTGIYHCCTFCSSGGKKEATCGCGGTMPGNIKFFKYYRGLSITVYKHYAWLQVDIEVVDTVMLDIRVLITGLVAGQS